MQNLVVATLEKVVGEMEESAEQLSITELIYTAGVIVESGRIVLRGAQDSVTINTLPIQINHRMDRDVQHMNSPHVKPQ